MPAVRSDARRKRATVAHKISSLEQHAAELAAQLKQLQLQNRSARRRESVLAAMCSATRLAVDMIQQLGAAIPGIAAPISRPMSLGIAKIDVCIDITLRDQHCAPLRTAAGPLCWPSDPHTPLAQQLADGGPLALLEHCLGLLQKHPQSFGWVQRQTPQTCRDMLYLIQGVIHQLHNMGQPDQDRSQDNGSNSSRQPTNTGFAVVGAVNSSSSNSHPSSSSSAPKFQTGTGECSTSAAVPAGLAAAAAGGVAAAVAAGGGLALGATLAFLEVAGQVHDALLAQQEQQQQQTEQQQQVGRAATGSTHTTDQQALVEAWAAAILAAAQHSSWGMAGSGAPAAASHAAAAGAEGAGPPCGEAGLSDVNCALLGAVMVFLGALQVVYMNEPGRVMALGELSIRPLPDAHFQATTQGMCLEPGQVREGLWVAALYRDLRKPRDAAHTELEMQVVGVLARMMHQQPCSAAGSVPEPAASPEAAAAAAAEPTGPAETAAAAGAAAEDVSHGTPPPASRGASSSNSGNQGDRSQQAPQLQPGSNGGGGGGDSSDPEADVQLLRQLLLQLQAQARLNMWWEVLQHSHVWGLLSLRQASAFIIGMAPAGPSPNCWITRLLVALLEAPQSSLATMTAAAAGISGATGRPSDFAGMQQQAGRGARKGSSRAPRSGPGPAQPWEPLPLVMVPPHLLHMHGGASCAAAAPTGASEATPGPQGVGPAPADLTASGGASPGGQNLGGASGGTPAAAAPGKTFPSAPELPARPTGVPAGVGVRHSSPAAGCNSSPAAALTMKEPCVEPSLDVAHPAVLCSRAQGGQPLLQQQQQPCMAGPPPPQQAAPGPSHPSHPGGWMAWLAAPSCPLGPDAAQYMPLVAAAQMSAAGAAAAAAAAGSAAVAAVQAAGGDASHVSVAAAAAEPVGDRLESLPSMPVLDLSSCDAPHSPVPPDLFEGQEQRLTPRPCVPLMEQACPVPGPVPVGVAGDGPTPLPFDLLDVRPDLALPDNALDLLQELLLGLDGALPAG